MRAASRAASGAVSRAAATAAVVTAAVGSAAVGSAAVGSAAAGSAAAGKAAAGKVTVALPAPSLGPFQTRRSSLSWTGCSVQFRPRGAEQWPGQRAKGDPTSSILGHGGDAGRVGG